MKKVLIVVFVALIVFAAVGCSSGVPQEEYDQLLEEYNEVVDELDELQEALDDANQTDDGTDAMPDDGEDAAVADDTDDTAVADDTENTTPASEDDYESDDTAQVAGSFDADTVLEQLETTSYIINGKYSSRAVLVMQNNSSFDIHIEVEAMFYNEEGALIGTSSQNTYAFESGQATALDFYNEDPIVDVQFSYLIEEEPYYNVVMSSLSIETSTTADKAIISVTNNADIPALFVEYVVIFFKDGEAVDADWGYCVDSNSEIAPGKTQHEEASASEDFDSVEVYLSARAD